MYASGNKKQLLVGVVFNWVLRKAGKLRKQLFWGLTFMQIGGRWSLGAAFFIVLLFVIARTHIYMVKLSELSDWRSCNYV